MFDGGGQKAQFVQSIGCFKALSRKATRTYCCQRLNDIPAVSLRVDIGIYEAGDAGILIRFESKVYDEGYHCQAANDHREERPLGNLSNEEKSEHHRHPNNTHPQIGLDQDQQQGSPNDRSAAKNPQDGRNFLRGLQIYCDRHDARQNRELRWLNAHEAKIEPALSAIPSLTKKQYGHQPEHAQNITGHRAKANPSVVDKGNDKERRETR